MKPPNTTLAWILDLKKRIAEERKTKLKALRVARCFGKIAPQLRELRERLARDKDDQ